MRLRRGWAALIWILLLILIPMPLTAQEATPPGPEDELPPGVTIHVVQRGENLFRIALNYGLTTEELAAYNGISDPANIQVGQRLLIPLGPGAAAPTEQPQTHVVQPGETLRSIADLYGMPIEDLAAMNGIVNPDSIFVGQELTVSAGAAPQQAAPPPTAQPVQSEAVNDAETLVHIVQPGETLYRIAVNYNLTVNQLAEANGITDPTRIYAGQRLIIPGVSAPELALDLPEQVTDLNLTPLTLTEGQTGRVLLTTAVSATVSASFLGRSFPGAAEDDGTQHTLFLAVPIFTEGNVYPLDIAVTENDGTQVIFTVNVQVFGGQYRSETLSLPAEMSGLLEPSVEEVETNIMLGVMTVFSPERYFDGPMSLPAAAAVTSPFGSRRSYNGSGFDRFHSGTDFAGAPGTPVLAAAPGRVVLADTLNIRGGTTIIDHGWGIYTVYCHQAEIYVMPGDFVTAGRQIGTIGATGRTTGAHLHWELWVNGVPVDGMQWVRQSFP